MRIWVKSYTSTSLNLARGDYIVAIAMAEEYLLAIAMAAAMVHTLWIRFALCTCVVAFVALCLPSVENLLRRAFPRLHRNRETRHNKAAVVMAHIRYRKGYIKQINTHDLPID